MLMFVNTTGCQELSALTQLSLSPLSAISVHSQTDSLVGYGNKLTQSLT